MPGPETQNGQEAQGRLFDDSGDGQPAVTETTGVDANEFAEIRHNPLVSDDSLRSVYEGDPSEAAIDQGWGQQPMVRGSRSEVTSSGSGNTTARKGRGTKSTRRAAGPLRGDSEGDIGKPASQEAYTPLGAVTVEHGKKGIKAARAILQVAQPPQPRRR